MSQTLRCVRSALGRSVFRLRRLTAGRVIHASGRDNISQNDLEARSSVSTFQRALPDRSRALVGSRPPGQDVWAV